MTRRAKIVATIGPSSQEVDTLRDLVQCGMNVARLNFSHGDHASHAQIIQRLREVTEEQAQAVAILQDLSGPKLRTGHLSGGGPIELIAGEEITLTTDLQSAGDKRIPVKYTRLPQDVSKGDTILLDDGRMELRVKGTSDTDVAAEIVVGGELKSDKGINLPGVSISAPALSEKDLEDLQFGLEQGVDAVAISFVGKARDIHDLREAIANHHPNPERIPVIAKLERAEAVGNLESIVQASDGVMVARGDLGVEVSTEKVPSLQKRIIREANAHNVLVITATEMLDSMIRNPRPTRAEASDVANAVFDGSDALMLSGETAIGKYPKESLQTMHRIIVDAESHSSEWGRQGIDSGAAKEDDAVATTYAARRLAMDRNVAAIAVFTRSGRTARLMSKARPRAPIMAFTPEQPTFRQLAMLWGVQPHLVPMAHSVEEMISHVREQALKSGLLVSGDQVVLVASLPVGAMGPPNFTLIHTIE